MKWLSHLVTPVDKIILDSSIASIESICQQIDTVSKEISKYASWDNNDVKIHLSITGMDIFCNDHIYRNSRYKTVFFTMTLVSNAGLAPSTKELSGKTKTVKITKQGSSWLKRILVQCALIAIRYDAHLRTFYDRIRNRRGHATAIVATAKELLVII